MPEGYKRLLFLSFRLSGCCVHNTFSLFYRYQSMRPGILFLGLVLVAIGLALYFVLPQTNADQRLARDTNTVPAFWPLLGLGILAIGTLLAIVGLLVPAYREEVIERDVPVVERTRTVTRNNRGRVTRVDTKEIRREDDE
jgi:hypothetical protein